MSRRRRKVEIILASLAVLTLTSAQLLSCPLCTRRETCFTTDIESSDVVLIGTTDSDSNFRPVAILKGGETVVSEPIRGIELPPSENLIVFGRNKNESIDGSKIEWFHQYSVTIHGMDYLRRLATSSPQQQLVSFLPFLSSPDLSVSDDAFYRIARSGYSDLKRFREGLDRRIAIALFTNPSSITEERMLALRMLAVCGSSDDAKYALEVINQPVLQNLRGIDVAMICYLTLQKQDALSDIEQRFIAQPNLPRNVKLAIIRALQFHLRMENKIDKAKLISALREFVVDPDVFDLVIPDLIQLKDWSAVNEVANIFKQNRQRLVRVTAAEYLLACPDDQAKQLLSELRDIDADAVIQAETGETVFSDVPKSRNDASFFTAFLASRFVSPTVLTVVMSVGLVSAVVFLLKRMRR